jgi:hypothetical protein
MFIDFVYEDTKSIISELSTYRKDMEEDLKLIQDKKEDELKENLEKDDLDFIEKGALEINNDWTYNYFFPRSLRYSFIVLLWIAVENRLITFCKVAQKRQNNLFNINEFSGNLIDRVKKYLRQMRIYEVIDWKFIEDLYCIRNCIVHAYGKKELLKDDREKSRLVNIVGDYKECLFIGDENDDEDILIIKAEYCEKAVGEVNIFFESLHNYSKL